jgi:hypothetical protein
MTTITRPTVVHAAITSLLASSMCFAGCHVRQAISSDLKMSDPIIEKQLLGGFYEVEDGQWRWTARRFGVALKPPEGSDRTGSTLNLKLFIPESQIQKLGPMTLSADAGDVTLAPETFAQAGSFLYSRDIPPDLLRTNLLPVVFSFNKALEPPDEASNLAFPWPKRKPNGESPSNSSFGKSYLTSDDRELAAIVTEVLLK